MTAGQRRALGGPIIGYAVVVVANYIVQVPYTLHLYGTAFSRSGALLLGSTLVWFVVALWLFRRGAKAGYWLLLAYSLVQLMFYLDSEVLMSFCGFGLPYHLSHTDDPIVWLAFVIGDLNLLGAAVAVVYLLRRRRSCPGRPRD